MVKFFRWLGGYVSFEFSKGFAEGFVNDCFNKGVNVHNLVREKDRLTGECSAKAYRKLHRIALKNGGVVVITKRHGAVFSLLGLRNRWGLFVGALCFVVLLCFLSGFVWNIEVQGNNEISDDEIIDFLADNDFAVGAHWRSVDKDVLESLIMASFDKCAWVHINSEGTTAYVEINETVDKPNVVDNSYITNLKATKDGIIVDAIVYDGWQVAKVGDSVVQGDLLVSGVYESEEQKTNLFAHARGEYIAKVEESLKITVSRQQSSKIYDKSKTYKTLNFFGLNIPLYIGSSYCMNSDSYVQSNYLVLNGCELPIGITTKTVKPYSVTSRVLDDRELTALINEEVDKKLEKEFCDYEIVSKNIDIALNSDEGVAKGNVTCLENIGEEFIIKSKK
jgi:similar to stage IV sporulation protein